MRIFVYVQLCVKLCGWVRFLKRRRATKEEDAGECPNKMLGKDARERCPSKMLGSVAEQRNALRKVPMKIHENAECINNIINRN